MEFSAVVMLIVGILIIWGGLGVSIFSAIKASKR